MTPEAKKKMDEMAEEYHFKYFNTFGERPPEVPVYSMEGHYRKGFEAGYQMQAEQIKKLEAENDELKAKVLEYQDGVSCIMCEKETEIKTEPFTECGVTVSVNYRVCKHCDMSWITGRETSRIDKAINSALKSRIEKLSNLLYTVDNFLCERIIDPCGYDPEKESKNNLITTVKANSSDNEEMLNKLRAALTADEGEG